MTQQHHDHTGHYGQLDSSRGGGDSTSRSHQYGDTSRQPDNRMDEMLPPDSSRAPLMTSSRRASSSNLLATMGAHHHHPPSANLPSLAAATSLNALLHLSLKGCTALLEPDPHLQAPSYKTNNPWSDKQSSNGLLATARSSAQQVR